MSLFRLFFLGGGEVALTRHQESCEVVSKPVSTEHLLRMANIASESTIGAEILHIKIVSIFVM